jgi:hypothetical protein
MNQKLREILVFTGLFALPFASAFVVEWWATFLFCPLGVIGLVGLNETLGQLRWARAGRPGDESP